MEKSSKAVHSGLHGPLSLPPNSEIVPKRQLFLCEAEFKRDKMSVIDFELQLSILYLVGGFNPSEKYEFVNWDHEIPNISGKIIQSCSSHHQPVIPR